MIEIKTAAKSYTVTRAYVEALYRVAVTQGKDAVLLLSFPGYDVTMFIEGRPVR